MKVCGRSKTQDVGKAFTKASQGHAFLMFNKSGPFSKDWHRMLSCFAYLAQMHFRCAKVDFPDIVLLLFDKA